MLPRGSWGYLMLEHSSRHQYPVSYFEGLRRSHKLVAGGGLGRTPQSWVLDRGPGNGIYSITRAVRLRLESLRSYFTSLNTKKRELLQTEGGDTLLAWVRGPVESPGLTNIRQRTWKEKGKMSDQGAHGPQQTRKTPPTFDWAPGQNSMLLTGGPLVFDSSDGTDEEKSCKLHGLKGPLQFWGG